MKYSEISELAWLREDDHVPKLGNQIDVAIYRSIVRTGLTVKDLTECPQESCTNVYYHDSGESYWTKGLAFTPMGVRDDKRVPASGWHSSTVPVRYRGFIVCLLNSSFFYWYWLTTTDCRHLTKGAVLGCPIPGLQTLSTRQTAFDKLCDELMRCYRQNTELVEKRRGYASPEITVRNCKSTIDQIDLAVGRAFGFKLEWIEYLIRYDADRRITE